MMLINEPLVSVLITLYNREAYIEKAIRSVIESSYKNIEVIVVDDGSTDSSLEIANTLAKEDNRISVYSNEQNLGDYKNRNKAASYAKGKYLKYVDSDDYIYSDWFDVMVSGMEAHSDAGLGLNRFVRNSVNPGPFYYSSQEAWRLQFFEKIVFSASPLSAIFRRDIFEKVGGFSDIRYSGDQDMWFKMTAISGLIVAEHPLAESRDHGDQEKYKGELHYLITGRNIEKKYVKDASSPLDDQEKKMALYLIDISHLYKILTVLFSGKVILGFKLIGSYKISTVSYFKILIDRIKLGTGFYRRLQQSALQRY